MGIMHHSNYIVMYEMARTEWLREMGLTYAEIERRGIMSPIIEVQSRYLYPAFYDELLTIKVFIEEMPSARLIIGSEVYNEQGKLINTGRVTLGFMHADTRRPCQKRRNRPACPSRRRQGRRSDHSFHHRSG